MPLTTAGHWFRDEHGRRLLLRGVNLGGSSKVPATPNGATHLPADFSDHRAVSFVGRPFPLSEADEHLRRLRHWGFNCLRLLTTWEAVEHAGPGEHDEAYLDYLRAVVRRAGAHGFYVFIDPHQDVWSRMSGGDGAPGWTLELAGFDLERLDVSEAAITRQRRAPVSRRRDRPWRLAHYRYGQMIWPNNRYRLASATLFTLFFAGDQFAPGLKVGGESIQSFLQRHFIAALQAVAERLADQPHVIGYDSLNEPRAGYIGLTSLSTPLPVYNSAPQLTGFQSLSIPAGFPCVVPFVERRGLSQVLSRSVTLNPDGCMAWRCSSADIWRQQGVWDVDRRGQPHLLQDNYFAGVRFFSDCLRPFARRYALAMRAVHPTALLFIESEPETDEPMAWDHDIPVVNASHWYDLLTLITKHYDPAAAMIWGAEQTVQGEAAVKASFAEQIGAQVGASQRDLGGVPTLIGEFGLPYDLDGGAAYRSGDFSPHIRALTAYYDALDAHLAHSTQWNYTSDNSHGQGDLWNQEDLSIFSRDDMAPGSTDPDAGGRAVDGFCRPYVQACAGTPVRQAFDVHTGHFVLAIESEPEIAAPTLIYAPDRQYPHGLHWQVTSGQVEYAPARQQLTWQGAAAGYQTLTLTRR